MATDRCVTTLVVESGGELFVVSRFAMKQQKGTRSYFLQNISW